MRVVRSALLMLAVSGCASMPNDPSEIRVGAGPEPPREALESIVLEHLRPLMKDPDSIKQFEITVGPYLRTWYRGLLLGGGYEQGWMVCFRYNAKNSYGAYVGVKQDGVMLRGHGKTWSPVSANWGLIPGSCTFG